jgi:hypothetical protein
MVCLKALGWADHLSKQLLKSLAPTRFRLIPCVEKSALDSIDSITTPQGFAAVTQTNQFDHPQ